MSSQRFEYCGVRSSADMFYILFILFLVLSFMFVVGVGLSFIWNVLNRVFLSLRDFVLGQTSRTPKARLYFAVKNLNVTDVEREMRIIQPTLLTKELMFLLSEVSCKRGNVPILRYLLSQNKKFRFPSLSDEKTPLIHSAISSPRNQIELLKTLLYYGFSINQKDTEGKTPLHIAVLLKRVDLVIELICCGADMNIKDAKDLSPISYAIQQKDREIIRILATSSF
jgi:hypothetical protein